MTTLKKKVETVFKKRIGAGLITQRLLVETISLHGEGLKEYGLDATESDAESSLGILLLAPSALGISTQFSPFRRASCGQASTSL